MNSNVLITTDNEVTAAILLIRSVYCTLDGLYKNEGTTTRENLNLMLHRLLFIYVVVGICHAAVRKTLIYILECQCCIL